MDGGLAACCVVGGAVEVDVRMCGEEMLVMVAAGRTQAHLMAVQLVEVVVLVDILKLFIMVVNCNMAILFPI